MSAAVHSPVLPLKAGSKGDRLLFASFRTLTT